MFPIFKQMSMELTWKLPGSLRSPSRFHVTILSGDDDRQSTTIESPGCKYDRAGSNCTYGATGYVGSCCDAISLYNTEKYSIKYTEKLLEKIEQNL